MKISYGDLGIILIAVALIWIWLSRQRDTVIVGAAPVSNNNMSTQAPRTDQTNLSFSSGKYTSTYHLYAGGLNWTKPVGLLLYTDGSGEYGLKHLSSSYLMAGTRGMVAVAKKHNMILLTPLSPNKNCADGDGSCWYMGDPPGYAAWVEALVRQVQSQYPIAKNRVAVGGYSSGAQFTTEWWVPSGAAQRTMTDGVIVAISYGGSPKMAEVAYTPAFKSNVPMNWNVGANDPSYTGSGDGKYGVKAGYNHYTTAGFKTSLDVIPGLSHDRSDFGAVMDAQITKHVPLGAVIAPVLTTQPKVTTLSGGVSSLNVSYENVSGTFLKIKDFLFGGPHAKIINESGRQYVYLYYYRDGNIFTTLGRIPLQ